MSLHSLCLWAANWTVTQVVPTRIPQSSKESYTLLTSSAGTHFRWVFCLSNCCHSLKCLLVKSIHYEHWTSIPSKLPPHKLPNFKQYPLLLPEITQRHSGTNLVMCHMCFWKTGIIQGTERVLRMPRSTLPMQCKEFLPIQNNQRGNTALLGACSCFKWKLNATSYWFVSRISTLKSCSIWEKRTTQK